MKLYLFDENTFRYAGEKEAVIDELDSKIAGRNVYRLEAHSTFELPTFKDGYYTVWGGSKWVLEEMPSIEEQQQMIQKHLTNVVQAYMDTEAQKYGYDNIFTVCTYIDTGVERFDNEGVVFRKWRSAVWQKCYAILDEVLAGLRDIPSEEELILELPVLEYGQEDKDEGTDSL